jgi:hypothetical protein
MRVTGPSAQRILLTHVASERCAHPGCTEPVVVTYHPDALTRKRTCMAHIGKSKKGKNVPRTRAW